MPLDFGIEIECLVPGRADGSFPSYELVRRVASGTAAAIEAAGVGCFFAGYNHQRPSTWKIVTDSSVHAPTGYVGLEIVSPPLSDDGLSQVETVCRTLIALGAKVNRSCGLHVHIGARALTINTLKKLACLYHDYEDAIDALMPPSRRRSNNTYCAALKGRTNVENLAQARYPQDIASSIAGGGRYVKLNYVAFGRHGTVEFRQHSGTVDPVKITKWVFFCSRLVELAQRTADEPRVAANVDRGLQAKLQRARKSAIIYALAARPGGVTAPEMQAALNASSAASPSIPLTRLNVPFRKLGRRNGHSVYKLVVPDGTPSPGDVTLPKLLEKLQLAQDDLEFWNARATLLAGSVSNDEQEVA